MKNVTAMMLVFSDNRAAGSEKDNVDLAAIRDSIEQLPLKRLCLRETAEAQMVEVIGEIFLTVDRNTNLDHVLSQTVESVRHAKPMFLITTDCDSLCDLGVLPTLLNRLEATTKTELVQIDM